jgi:hypothetical protein
VAKRPERSVASGRGLTDQPRELRLAWPWWLHPVAAVLLLTGSTAVVAIVLPAESYRIWDVQKYLDPEKSSWLLIFILCLIVGMALVAGRAVRSGAVILDLSSQQVRYLRKAYRILFGLTLLGYVFWSASAILQGVGLSQLQDVISLQSGAIGELKASSRPIGGVTTLTQFGPVVVVLGAILHEFGLTKRWFLVIAALAAFRALFYAERLALIEVALPLLIVSALIALGRREGRFRGAIQLAPLVAGPGIWAFFAMLEYTRSWVYYQTLVSQPFVEWVSLRLLGYYVTSFNNSAMFNMAMPPGNVPYFSALFFWNAPGVDKVLDEPIISGVQASNWWWYLLNSDGNVAFTNSGSFLVIDGEFGHLFGVLYWLGLGAIVGLIYVGMRRGSVPALLTYCALFTALLELPRFMYWVEGRSVPIVLACLVIAATYPKSAEFALKSQGQSRLSATGAKSTA